MIARLAMQENEPDFRRAYAKMRGSIRARDFPLMVRYLTVGLVVALVGCSSVAGQPLADDAGGGSDSAAQPPPPPTSDGGGGGGGGGGDDGGNGKGPGNSGGNGVHGGRTGGSSADAGPSTTLQVNWARACWDNVNGQRFQAIHFDLSAPAPVTLQGTLYFATGCDASSGTQVNDNVATITSGSYDYRFTDHPDQTSTSAIWTIEGQTSGCLDYQHAQDCR
jgi:hypothetical protein